MNHIFKAIALKIEQLDNNDISLLAYFASGTVILGLVAIFSK